MVFKKLTLFKSKEMNHYFNFNERAAFLLMAQAQLISANLKLKTVLQEDYSF